MSLFLRLFISVNFDSAVKEQLLEIQGQLRSQCARGNFTRSENLHLTLAFLGETPEEQVPSILKIIEDVRIAPDVLPEAGHFEISFSHTGCFTHSHKELWWIGVDENCPGLCRLKAIHGELIRHLSDAGISVDKRPFNPHITLGREVKHLQQITLNCSEIKAKVNRISLMKSERIGGKLAYSELS